MKRVWQRPELVVLCRGNPEEAVLSGCKIDLFHQPQGPGTYISVCYGQLCGAACNAPASS